MPYYQYEIEEDEQENDEENEDEDDGKEPAMTEEMYEPAGTTVRFDADPFVKGVHDALVEKGITTVNCHYDGGYDEGFAHFDKALVNQTPLTTAELIALLKDGPILDPSLNAQRFAHFPPHALESMFGEMAATPVGVRIAAVLEEFAQKLAWELFGEGFGIGDYQMRGRFRADLETGKLTDLKDGE